MTLTPGDALVVNCGREAYQRDHGPWGVSRAERAGLHASCLRFMREYDVAILVWDMLDHAPLDPGVYRGPHAALYALGVGLVDNARLDRLSAACAEEQRYEFMLTMAPLVVIGGTGSPINPIALF